MLEAAFPAQQHGDYEQSQGNAAYAAEGARLIAAAKACGRYVPKAQWSDFGQRKRTPSGESVVFINADEKSVVKVRDPFAKAVVKRMHAQDAIYEHLVHNILFPDTRYTLVGIGDEGGDVRIILRQAYLSDKYAAPTQRDIDRYLTEGLGLTPEDRYFYGNEWVAITDVAASGDNVLCESGQLFFIDPIIKMKQPATAVLEHYYQLIK